MNHVPHEPHVPFEPWIKPAPLTVEVQGLHHWTSKKSQIDAIVTLFLTYSWPLNKTGFNSMDPLTQTFSNSKYNSHTLSTLLKAVDVEEPSCLCAGRAVALWLCGRIGALILSCVRGNWTESISCWRSRATLSHCCYISHTMGTVCFTRGGTATNIYREDTAATFSLILSNSLSSQNHSAGTKGIHSEQKPNLRSIKNKNIYKHTKYIGKYPTFISFTKICYNLAQSSSVHAPWLYSVKSPWQHPYVMTGRDTVVYHFWGLTLDQSLQQAGSYKDGRKNPHSFLCVFFFLNKNHTKCFLKREISKVYNCHGNTY